MENTTTRSDENLPLNSLVFSKETVIATVVKHLHTLHEADTNTFSPTLKKHYTLWHNYPANTEIEKDGGSDEEREKLLKIRREQDINDTLNAVQEHLAGLPGVSQETLFPFSTEGLFRKNLIKYAKENDVIPFMKEHLSYISLLTQVFPKKTEHETLPLLSDDEQKDKQASIKAAIEKGNEKLAQFPPSNPAEYACLEGMRDRQDIPLIALVLEKISPEERAILVAHKELVEQARIKCSPGIADNNQPHVISAIEYLYGIEVTKHFAKPIAMAIAAEEAWKATSGYSDALNKELTSQRAENIRGIEYLMDANPIEQKGSTAIVGKLMEARGIALNDICTIPEDTLIPAWDKNKIPALFPVITTENPVTLAVPESLFALDAPRHIADLIDNDIPANREMGIKALLLMGHEGQTGSSPIQFLNTLHALGLKEGAAPVDALDKGIAKLICLRTPENTALSANIDTVVGHMHYHRQDRNIRRYIKYLEGGVIPPVSVFFAGNAPATVLQERIASATEAALNEPFFIDTIFHNPGRQLILDSLLHKGYPLAANNAFKIGKTLTALGAQYRDPEIIHYVRRGFLSSETASAIGDSKPYTHGVEMVHAGLLHRRSTPSGTLQPTGLEYLTTYDARMLEGIIGNGSYDGGDRVSSAILKEYSDDCTIIHTLATRGDKVNLNRVLSLLPIDEQRILLAQQENTEWGDTALHIAAQVGDQNVIALLTTDPTGPKMPPDILNKKGETPLIIAASTGKLEAVKILVAAGAKLIPPTIHRQKPTTALHIAARKGYGNIVAFLIADPMGPKMDSYIRDKNEHTPLMLAVDHGKIDTVTLLLKAGVYPCLYPAEWGNISADVKAEFKKYDEFKAVAKAIVASAKKSLNKGWVTRVISGDEERLEQAIRDEYRQLVTECNADVQQLKEHFLGCNRETILNDNFLSANAVINEKGQAISNRLQMKMTHASSNIPASKTVWSNITDTYSAISGRTR